MVFMVASLGMLFFVDGAGLERHQQHRKPVGAPCLTAALIPMAKDMTISSPSRSLIVQGLQLGCCFLRVVSCCLRGRLLEVITGEDAWTVPYEFIAVSFYVT